MPGGSWQRDFVVGEVDLSALPSDFLQPNLVAVCVAQDRGRAPRQENAPVDARKSRLELLGGLRFPPGGHLRRDREAMTRPGAAVSSTAPQRRATEPPSRGSAREATSSGCVASSSTSRGALPVLPGASGPTSKSTPLWLFVPCAGSSCLFNTSDPGKDAGHQPPPSGSDAGIPPALARAL